MANNSNSARPAQITDRLQRESKSQFPLLKINFILMAVAAVMIVVGFALTAGGSAPDDTQFNPEVFSLRRTVIGPNLAFLGYIFMGVGIMWTGFGKKKDKEEVKD